MNAGAKIVHLTSVHAASDVRIFHKQCCSLAAAGYNVTVVAPPGHSDTPASAGRQTGVTVRNIPKPSTRWRRMSLTLARLLRAALTEQADLYHFHDPELLPLGVVLKCLGKRVIYDVHEDVPQQILAKHWLPSFLRRGISRAARLAEWIAAHVLDGIVAATPTIATKFPVRNTATVQNFPLLDEFSLTAAPPPGAAVRAREIVYVGGITKDRGLGTLLDALIRLPQMPATCLTLAGNFCPPGFEAHLRAHPGWERVNFQGWCDRPAIARLLAQARVGVVVLEPLPRYQVSQPVKLFEYMAAGLPVIASDFPLWREIVTQADCGLLVNPCDPQAIAEAIRWLLDHPAEAQAMGQRGRTAVFEKYNWDNEAKVLLNLYQRILKTGRPLSRDCSPELAEPAAESPVAA